MQEKSGQTQEINFKAVIRKWLPIVVAIWILGGFLPLLFSWFRPEVAGTLGDMFGAVNALFSALAFSGVILTVLMQRDELRLQRRELELQREEMEKSREALERQAEIAATTSQTNALSLIMNTFTEHALEGMPLQLYKEFRSWIQDMHLSLFSIDKDVEVSPARLDAELENDMILTTCDQIVFLGTFEFAIVRSTKDTFNYKKVMRDITDHMHSLIRTDKRFSFLQEYYESLSYLQSFEGYSVDKDPFVASQAIIADTVRQIRMVIKVVRLEDLRAIIEKQRQGASIAQ